MYDVLKHSKCLNLFQGAIYKFIYIIIYVKRDVNCN